MGWMISSVLCALLWAGVFGTEAVAARAPLPGQKPAELRIEALLRDARNAQALALAERQVRRAQTQFGADRPLMAAALNTLAEILSRYARYAEAEEKARAALEIHEAALGADAPETATSLNVLGAIATDRGGYKEAALLLERALAINERAGGAEHPALADSLAALASLKQVLSDPAAAEPLARRALDIRGKALGDHPDTADSAELLGAILFAQNRRADAEPLFRRAASIRSAKLEAGHRDFANSLEWEGLLLQLDGKLAEAEPPMQRAIDICISAFGANHPCTASARLLHGGLREAQNRRQDAEVLYQRALAAYEATLGATHKQVGVTLRVLGRLYRKSAHPKEAEAAFTRALAIFETVYGAEHFETLYALRDLGGALDAQGRFPEAAPYHERALAVSRTLFGDEHLQTYLCLIPLTSNYAARGLFAKAEQSLKQTIALGKTLKEGSVNFEIFQSSLAIIYNFQHRFIEAEALLRELLDATEKNYGGNDLRTAKAIEDLAINYVVQARYRDAEALYRRDIAIRETLQGQSHPETIKSIEGLASLLTKSARFAEAEKLLTRVLAFRESGGESLELADTLGSLGILYQQMGRYQRSEDAYRRALAIDEKLEPRKFFITTDLNNYAGLLSYLARFSEAEALYKRALAITQETVEPDHPSVATFLNNLGAMYREQGRIKEAVELNGRALEIYEKHGSDLATPLNNRAGLYSEQGRYAEAEQLLRQALAENEGRFGAEHPDVATSLHNLAANLSDQGRMDEVGPLFLRAIAINEKAYGPEHPEIANMLGSLASLRSSQGRNTEAEQHYRRAVTIYEAAFGPDHPDTARSYHNLGSFYTETGRADDGEPLQQRARAIWEKTLGAEHPATLIAIANLASAANAQKHYAEAESLYKQTIDLREKVLGADHPDTARALNNLASFYLGQRRFADAVAILERTLPILQARLGEQHPLTAIALMNTGLGLMELQKYPEAGPLLSRAQAIQQHVLGQDHPDTAQTLTVIAALKEKSGADLAGAYALNQQASAVVLNRARRESGRLDEVEGARNRAELVGSANVLMRQAQIGRRLAGQAPERAPALLDEGFQMAQWAHQSAAAAALSQMTSRVAKDESELPLLVRRRQDLVWRYRALDHQLVAASANPPEVRDAGVEAGVRKELAHLDAAIRTLDLTLKTSFPGYAALANPEPLSVAEAQAQLRNGEVLYQVAIGREKSVAWAITSGEARWQELPIGEEALKDDVEALRCGLDAEQWATPTKAQRCKDLVGREPEQRSQPPFDLGRASKLYQTLFAPFEALIANRHLLFVPSGPLTTLPLHVLVTEAPSQDEALSEIERLVRTSWLGKRQPITVLPSVASLKVARTDAKPSAANNPFISFANPLLSGANGRDRRAWRRQSCELIVISSAAAGEPQAGTRASSSLTAGAKVDLASLKGQNPLPETADEACAVAHSLGAGDGDVYLGAKASEAVLKSLSLRGLLKTYRVVHFATHGLIAGETELFFKSKTEPSLLMTPPDFADEEDDGLLTASEIAELSLDADVVVLSACNTASTSGAPEAEALSGLARAFFYAGGRALLVTHWYVNSVAAVGLVTDAFSELKREPGLKLADAMRRAMTRDIDAGGERAHPAFWAPFVVVAAN